MKRKEDDPVIELERHGIPGASLTKRYANKRLRKQRTRLHKKRENIIYGPTGNKIPRF